MNLNKIKEDLINNYSNIIENDFFKKESNLYNVERLYKTNMLAYNNLINKIVFNPLILKQCENYNYIFIMSILQQQKILQHNFRFHIFYDLLPDYIIKDENYSRLVLEFAIYDRFFFDNVNKEHQTKQAVIAALQNKAWLDDYSQINEKFLDKDVIFLLANYYSVVFDNMNLDNVLNDDIITHIVKTIDNDDFAVEIFENNKNYQKYVDIYLKRFPEKIYQVGEYYLTLDHWKAALQKDINLLKHLHIKYPITFDDNIKEYFNVVEYASKLYGDIVYLFIDRRYLNMFKTSISMNKNILYNYLNYYKKCLRKNDMSTIKAISTNYNEITKVALLSNPKQLRYYIKEYINEATLEFIHSNVEINQTNAYTFALLIKFFENGNN